MMRKSVVLPEPDGPSNATSSPVSTLKLTSSSAAKSPKVLLMLRISILIRLASANACSRIARTSRASTCDFQSTAALSAIVTSVRIVSNDATANAAAKLYSL